MALGPDPARRRSPLRQVWVPRIAGLAFALVCAGAFGSALSAGCSGWDPTNPFERNSPQVDEALQFIDSGQFESAEDTLSRFLGTGLCADGGIALPEAARDKHSGVFDLGIVLFHIAEKYGRPFGEEETGEPGQEDPKASQRSLEIDCALIVVKAIAADPKVPVELRARARYLAGNLEFLRRRYEEAVEEYDQALTLVPGIEADASGDAIGRDAAWNRAIALRRIQDQKDAGPDADADSQPDSDGSDGDDGEADAPDAPDGDDAADGDDGDADSGDSGDDASDGDAGPNPPDAGKDGGSDAGDGGPDDAGKDAGDGGKPDDKNQDQEPQPDPDKPPEPATPTPQRGQDDRILEELEEAPSYQEEEAKKRAAGRRRGRMEDK